MARSRRRATLSSAFAAAWLILCGAGAASANDAWNILADFRAALDRSGPLSAGFVQTFIPYGFKPEEGETERGRLAIDLPRCLRWDYSPPFEKCFLLCDRTVHQWSPGEPSGQRYRLSEQAAPGLDFFLLTTEELRRRYRAVLESDGGDRALLVLEPILPGTDVAEVRVVIDREQHRLRELTYSDAQQNENRFVIGDYRSGAAPDRFQPPTELVWEEPQDP